jgi:hypothetical protein
MAGSNRRRGLDGKIALRNVALIVWAAALCAVCVRVTVQKHHKQSSYHDYFDAGMHWRQHVHLYAVPGDFDLSRVPPGHRRAGSTNVAWGGIRHPPVVAVTFTVLTVIPIPVGEVLWRMLLAVVSLASLWWASRSGIPRVLARRDWPIIALLSLWPFVGCLNNGQASCIVVACLLGAVTAAKSDRWSLAALFAAIATLLKIYPVSLGLLLAVTYPRRFALRYALFVALGFAIPFAFRPGAWVVDEYRRWLWHMFNDAIPPDQIGHWDQDVRLVLIRILHLRLDGLAFMALQLIIAAAIAGVCLAGQRAGWPRRTLLGRIFGLSVCWMTVFGQATEPSTYVLVAPALAWAIWEAWLPRRNSPAMVRKVLLATCYALFITAYVVLWFPQGKQINSYGFEPLGGLLLFGYLMIDSVRGLGSGKFTPLAQARLPA